MRPFVLLLSSALFSAAHAQAQSEIRIGSASPLSGPGAHLGKDIENGARMAVDDLNAKGVTIGGRKVKWVLQAEDDGSDPKAGTAVAQKLVDAGVAAVVGHLNSGTTVPASLPIRPIGSGAQTRNDPASIRLLQCPNAWTSPAPASARAASRTSLSMSP